MNVFRISIIVLILTLLAGAVVHIRLKNWHYAYLINQRYDQYQRLQRQFAQTQLELARYQSPDNLLERLNQLKLPLEGYGLTPAASDNKTTTKKAVKPAEKPVKSSKRNGSAKGVGR